MKFKEGYKVREMAGEYVAIKQGRFGGDMTHMIALNATSHLLWKALQERDFEVEDVVAILLENYKVDESIAKRDAERWVEQLRSCGML